jgi:hypothetical protein
MRLQILESVFRALNEAQVEYLVVGGVAVIGHGHIRMTNDLDLVLDLSSDRLSAALRALASTGLRPRAPVPILDFADPALRANWRNEKQMVVFNLFDPTDPGFVVDLFVVEPFDFKGEYARAKFQELAPNVFVPLVSIECLIAMKRAAGRAHDLTDIRQLEIIQALAHGT